MRARDWRGVCWRGSRGVARLAARLREDMTAFSGARIVGFEVVPYSINHAWDRTEEFDE